MTEEHLDVLLGALARKPLPQSAANLEASVWRAIRLREENPSGMVAVLDYLAASLWRVKVIACSVVTAGAVGATMAFAWQAAVPDPAAGALGLRVFSADAPSLPSTLLTQ